MTEPASLADRLDAIADELRQVYADTQAMRRQLADHGAQLGAIGQRLDGIDQAANRIEPDAADSIGQQLTDHGHLLTEILRRLPVEPDA